MGKVFFGIFLFFIAGSGFSQSDTPLILSEIMFNPQSGNNEFIEIYNRSETQSFDLNNFKIIYYTSNADVITSAGFGTILPPKSFAVILEGDYDFATGIYNSLIPANSLILKISDNSFGTSGMANTTDRPLWFISAASDTIDRHMYSANNSTGFSEEKILMNRDSTAANWANSVRLNGTPGSKNSVTPVDYDLRVKSFNVLPSIPIQGDNVQIFSTIINNGIAAASPYSIEMYNDTNFDSSGSASEIIYSQSFLNLLPGDSVSVNTTLFSIIPGLYQIIAKVIFNLDEDTTNNKKILTFTTYPPGNNYNDLVINEIMYAPSSDEPEWVEIFNRTGDPINLKKWKIGDNSSSTVITNSDLIIQPSTYFVLSRDSLITNYFPHLANYVVLSLPSLNNTGDAVVLKDSLSVLIDSLSYLPEWGGNENGKSLERISINSSSILNDNWRTSTSKYKATPGYINSVTQKEYDIQVSDIVFNPALPFFGDNISISAKLKNTGTNAAIVNLKLWDDTELDSLPNSIIANLEAVNVASGDSVTAQFNFNITNIQSEKGFFVTADFPQDQDTSSNYFYKRISPGYISGTISINEIMFSPINGEPEWIEIYNNSSDSINLNNWSITDILTTPVAAKINYEVYLKEKSYLVLAKDSTLQFYHRVIPSKVVKVSLPNLNNDVDGVVFKDDRGITIDSVKYFSDFGGTGGKSLERIALSANSNLPGNWGLSTDLELSTPGRINGLTPKQFDLSIAEISFTPRFPTTGENVFINAKIKNNGSAAANNFSVEFYTDTDSNQIVDYLLSRIDGLSLNSSDSAVFASAVPINNLSSKILAAVKIIFDSDEDTLNNYAEKTVEPGFSEKSIIINEIMYAPENGEPEWIELLNISNQQIDLKDWSLSDILTSPTKSFITNSNLQIQPGEYFVITRDTSFYNFHSPLNYKVFIRNFGSLGNTEDGIILYDFRSGIIDSFSYNSSFGGTNGYSLERVSPDQSTNDSSNWITSLSINRSTPGEQNSIFNIPSYQKGDLVINEIMFDPDIDNGEFIEFINLSSDSINVGGWQIEDENQNVFKLSQTSMLVAPNQYFLMTADSLPLRKFNLEFYQYKSVLGVSSLGLINTGELILLKDARGNVIDSVWYSDKWHNKNFIITKNISLERINPDLNGNDSKNWSSSVSPLGASPGSSNSILTDNPNLSAKISVSPNPFSPDNDGFEDFTIINYTLSQQTAQVRVKIFDSKGRLVRTLMNNQPSGSSGSVVFDGIGDDGAALRIGIYIIFLEALNETNGTVENLKTVVVVARKL
ncbi:MAG: lamin tail domain-containing protein [Ignavibacteriaceae bacterium]|nr:lamin tail domain-containing protein [Ignavibacteriaceae bacterium]